MKKLIPTVVVKMVLIHELKTLDPQCYGNKGIAWNWKDYTVNDLKTEINWYKCKKMLEGGAY